ncbi:hypothetical protein Tco_0122418 [Tanacetum coccineum]
MQGTSYDSNTGKCVQDIREDTIRLSRKTNFREAHNNAKRKWAHTRNVKAKATQDSLLQGQDATNKQAQGSESSNGLRTVVDSCRGTGYRTLKLSDNSPVNEVRHSMWTMSLKLMNVMCIEPYVDEVTHYTDHVHGKSHI